MQQTSREHAASCAFKHLAVFVVSSVTPRRRPLARLTNIPGCLFSKQMPETREQVFTVSAISSVDSLAECRFSTDHAEADNISHLVGLFCKTVYTDNKCLVLYVVFFYAQQLSNVCQNRNMLKKDNFLQW